MLSRLRSALDEFWGRGDAAVTVPPMDGALRPNRILDDMPEYMAIEAPDDLAILGRRVFVSSNTKVMVADIADSRSGPLEFSSFAERVTCLAAWEPDCLAIGLSGDGVRISGGPHDGRHIANVGDRPLACATAAVFVDRDTILVCQGSEANRPEHWKRDLMERHSSGSVWRVDLSDGTSSALARDLAFPDGICVSSDNEIIVAEAWRHRLVAVSALTPPATRLADLPAYPGRVKSGRDAIWLPLFAPRRQLVEFVLREQDFRNRMMDQVPEKYWMAPSLRTGRSFLEPLQGGAVKQLGQSKPWAPSLSYGLIARLDRDLRPTFSAHSRADGTRHGVTSCAELDSTLLVAAQGHDVVVAIDLASQSGRGQ